MVNRYVLLVTGGRKHADRDTVYRVLDNLHAQRPITLLVHGDATGADTLADQWAAFRGVLRDPHPAAWNDLTHPDARIVSLPGRRPYDANAGTRRNRQMLKVRPDQVVAFPGGSGTADMCKAAEAAGVPVLRVAAEMGQLRLL